MTRRSLPAACAFLLLASAATAQDPKKTPPNTDEQKAREAFLAGKLDDALKSLQAAAKTNPFPTSPS